MQYELPEWASPVLLNRVLAFSATAFVGFAIVALIKECYASSASQQALIHFQRLRIYRLECENRALWNDTVDLQDQLTAVEDERDEALEQRDTASSIATHFMRPIATGFCRLWGIPSPVEYDSDGEVMVNLTDNAPVRLRGETPSPGLSAFNAYR
ncbi:MAG: hypothetical protein P1U63_13225 [Coxiellaceae bacterium]|nr:hypothetical protein [Coxiellaceae bacterium]